MLSKDSQSGFTVIELLIVIAIIGILVAVVLPRLQTARDEGIEAKIKTEMNMIGKRASVEESKLFTYDVVCATSGFTQAVSITEQINLLETFSGEIIICNSATDRYAISIPVAGEHWCVDSAGNRKGIPDALTPGELVCP